MYHHDYSNCFCCCLSSCLATQIAKKFNWLRLLTLRRKNGKPATQGTCPTCGTKMFRIGKA
ncbi:MAG: hypothetical protein COY46_00295 [Chloroflexi bacterium CG_4_10_14_0_8_um_filter_46_9]|nr:MAG: hypothetical protein COY46_00295 [Chloroflexi bacterium CG_4_10_14_0_8_um_filter_46_9]